MTMLAYDGNIFLQTTHDFSLDIFCAFDDVVLLLPSKCFDGDRCDDGGGWSV